MKDFKKHYDRKYFCQRDLLDLHLAETIKILMKKHNFKSLLDVGCGTGRLVKYLNEAGFKAKGCDNSLRALEFAKKIAKNQVFFGSADKLPCPKNSFDMVIAISIIEHLTKEEAEEFIKEGKRVLKKGGLIFLVTPNYATPIRFFQGKKWFGYQDPTHINFFTPKSLKNLLKKNGFKDTKFQFKTVYDPPYDWDLPYCSKLPKITRSLLTYLLISSPLSKIRNSFWISGVK